MKKNGKKIIAAILSFVFLFSGAFSLMVSADEIETSEDYLRSHFGALKYSNNVLCPPSQNTCSLVALSMLLSYYDSYWSDNFIIPMNGNDLDWDQGVFNSNQGIVKKTFSATEERTSWYNWYDEDDPEKDSYCEYTLDYEDEYFEPYLISLGREWNYFSENTTIYFMWAYEIRDYLERYIRDVCLFSESEVTIHMLREVEVGDESILATMTEQISKGNPVIYCGGRFAELEEPTGDIVNDFVYNNFGAHAMIAYGVEDDGDVLLHTGWSGYENTTVNDTVYKYFNSIIWIEINYDNLAHDCSDAYRDEVNGNNLCACDVFVSHPAHETKDYYCHLFNNNTHFYECNCGFVFNVEQHDLTYSNYSSTQHCESCTTCGYSLVENHAYNEYFTSLDSHNHAKLCECGEITYLQPHFLTYTNFSSSHHCESCSSCDYISYSNHNYYIPTQYTNTEHKLKCPCGAVGTTTSAHIYGRYTQKDKDLHYVYCDCGYLIGTDTHSMVPGFKLGTSTCSKCGYTRDNTGAGTIIKGVETEKETE